MKPQHHAIIGGAVALALVPALGVNSAVFWASSVLIDGDHYIDYVYRNGFKDYSIKRMFDFHDLLSDRGKERSFISLNLMHTAEFILLLGVAVAITGWTWLIAMLGGILLHMLLDLSYMYRQGILFSRAFSIIEYFIRWRRMKRQGLRPELHYQVVLDSMFDRQDRLKTR